MKTGETVRFKQPEIRGPIRDTEYDKEAQCLRHLVEFIGTDGETHTRWFLETELEVTP